MSSTARMSVVVALISGRTNDLRRCLQALQAQTLRDEIEVLVPYDDPCADVVTLHQEFPAVRFLHARGLETAKARAGGSREHHDTLRTLGIRAAAGTLVALTEDHAHVADNWCSALADAMARSPSAGAVGGAVECDASGALARAIWFCDFGRYQNPLPEGPTAFVSDSNVVYRREALDAIADAWKENYHETSVHWAMVRSGFALRTTPLAVVWQSRAPMTFPAALFERYVWGRSFAATRAQLLGARRFALALGTPLLPLLMTWRVARISVERARHANEFFACMPLVLALHAAWAVGELVGYVSARR